MIASRPQRWAMSAITWYQGVAAGRLSPCRFYPSCSTYAHDAYALHGAGRGSWLTIRRLLRCRPFGATGYDPVPDPSPVDPVDPAARLAAQNVAHKDC